MARLVVEPLAISAQTQKPVRCPFSSKDKHSGKCTCLGTNAIQACHHCDGSGWNAKANAVCKQCSGKGCYSATFTTPAKFWSAATETKKKAKAEPQAAEEANA